MWQALLWLTVALIIPRLVLLVVEGVGIGYLELFEDEIELEDDE